MRGAPVLAAFLLWVGPASAAESPAGRFITHLYDQYGPGGSGVDLYGPRAREFYDPALLDLLARDRARAGGETGSFDYDPVCACQDFEIRDVTYALTRRSRDVTDAHVTFTNFGKAEAVDLTLRRTNGAWKILDLGNTSARSLRALLSRPRPTTR
ncbi:hypothetical protein OPKNFCMD_2713 [Methylobacterium crusticola]|uniref:DUF3828 domain-containing protein n=1 Tax=Methylobacterium crusticola TaxID=1697972 RepID=A0ABQ4QX60_9HYPH|nr:DUF3828 domain-containing protein [Methylobacterium crusticola]GJD49977.1 hypothetical protein OPKNFCMD_2713 [Methylobacterium crusticola]